MYLYSYFPEFIYEGIIQEVDYSAGYCRVSPLSSRNDTELRDVPIPHFAGMGNAGIWIGNLKPGSRVIVANTSGGGREFSVIIGRLPNINKFSETFSESKPLETPSGATSYPEIVEGRIVLAGDQGSYLRLNENGEVYINAGGNGAGYYLKKFGVKSVASYKVAQEQSCFSNAGRSYQGVVRRLVPAKRQVFPKTTLNEVPLFADLDFHNVSTPVGFFNGSRPFQYSFQNKKRNPELVEHRVVINEFSTESMFTGFDDEVKRTKQEKSLFENSETRERHREPSNILQLAEHELIEVIGGNLVDFKGNILDINYNKLSYGEPKNRTPQKDLTKGYDSARRLSRRGIGFHFLLSTNTLSSESSTSNNSFLFDIDKEGVMKMNIPRSSDTGNVPFASLSEFDNETNTVTTNFLNPSTSEPIPVTLRDKDGIAVLPPPSSSKQYRETGVRFANSENNSYFPNNSENKNGVIRVNTTKYHNMYSIAERLIANNINAINIPESFTDDNGLAEGLAIGKPFEIYDQEEDTSESISDLNSADFQLPNYMSTVKIVPGAPAIYSGGDTIIAGVDFTDETNNPPFSNSFVLQPGENDELSAKIIDPLLGQERTKTGGKSANLNFEGSVEVSIGADNTDQKSLVLDTAGSLLAWLGKDANGRSGIIQTDGELLINVGGTYDGTDLNDRSMNVGKFVLRVNVTDKKHIGTEFDSDTENPKSNSDFIISISEEGLVIAGMKQGVPMVFRNSGKILIESETDLVLKGNKVEQVDAKGKATTPSVPGRG